VREVAIDAMGFSRKGAETVQKIQQEEEVRARPYNSIPPSWPIPNSRNTYHSLIMSKTCDLVTFSALWMTMLVHFCWKTVRLDFSLFLGLFFY
jgi:hypothetical protein